MGNLGVKLPAKTCDCFWVTKRDNLRFSRWHIPHFVQITMLWCRLNVGYVLPNDKCNVIRKQLLSVEALFRDRCILFCWQVREYRARCTELEDETNSQSLARTSSTVAAAAATSSSLHHQVDSITDLQLTTARLQQEQQKSVSFVYCNKIFCLAVFFPVFDGFCWSKGVHCTMYVH